MTIKTYLGFDVGTKRTGVAIANSLTAQANGIDTVIHNKDGSTNWKGLENLISQHNPRCDSSLDSHLIRIIKSKK